MLPMTFWGGWAAGITLLGLVGLAWLAWGVYSAPPGAVQPPDEVWDENLREGGTPPPKWWFFALFATLIFSVIYIILYPGFGDNKGLLNWQQNIQYEAGRQHYLQRTAETHERWRTAPMATLQQDSSSMASARRLFLSNCAACHGDDGRGQAGLFPDLTDAEWTWGGSEAQVMHSLTEGRVAAMPGFDNTLTDTQIQSLVDYVIALHEGRTGEASAAAGEEIYQANCAICHGAGGQGNPALGAPQLTGDHRWLYLKPGGDLRAAIVTTIRQGRQGVMPGQKNRLRPEQIRILAAWLTGGIAEAPLVPLSLGEHQQDGN